MEQQKFGHAVVIGRSMAGLTAARALSDHFEKVTIIDRDSHPGSPKPRKGVPQGRHIHVLMQPGQEVLEDYFPGILEDLQKKGMNLIDSSRDMAWSHYGVWKKREESNLPMVLCMRYFLEYHVRKRLSKIPNVKFMMRTAVEKPLTNEAGDAITGVLVRPLQRWKRRKEIKADLVVDASGRGSQTPRWLKELGYQPPEEERFVIDLAYTSRLYRPPKKFDAKFKFLVQYPRPPEQHRAGFISSVEKNLWIVSLNGYFKDHAPLDEKGFLEFAKSLPQQDLYNYVKDAKPVSDISQHKIHDTYRRSYEKLKKFPGGLVVLGDAFCAVNPIFGQGMTIASLESRALREEVARQRRESPGDLSGLSGRFFKRVASIVDLPWLITTTEDLRYPETQGKKAFGVDFLNWYKGQLLELCSTNTSVNQEFYRLVHLKSSLPALLHPSISVPAIMHGIKSAFLPLSERAHTAELPGVQKMNGKEAGVREDRSPAA